MITDIQKASLSKRIAAGMLDMMLLCVLTVGFMWLLMSVLDYNSYHTAFRDGLTRYEQEYNVDFESDYNSLPKAEQQRFDEAYQAVNSDSEIMKNFSMMFNLILITTTFGILLGIFILEFIVPLILKNGQTIGKKVFSLGLVRVDSVQVSNLQLFVRSILGKFTIEIMIPVYIIIMIMFNSIGIVGLLVLAGILLTELIMMIATKTNSLIHDTLSGTVAVDFASQMIFRTTEDLIAYKKKIHAEQAARSNY